MAAVESDFNVKTLLFAGTVCTSKYSMSKCFVLNVESLKHQAHISENFQGFPLNQQETLQVSVQNTHKFKDDL